MGNKSQAQAEKAAKSDGLRSGTRYNIDSKKGVQREGYKYRTDQKVDKVIPDPLKDYVHHHLQSLIVVHFNTLP